MTTTWQAGLDLTRSELDLDTDEPTTVLSTGKSETWAAPLIWGLRKRAALMLLHVENLDRPKETTSVATANRPAESLTDCTIHRSRRHS